MDVIIISTNTKYQEDYWQKRLNQLRGVICKETTIVLAITEDWKAGAGNGLGTLYAYRKAQEKAKFMYRLDLYEMQKNGAAVAIYHTGGQGKSLFPLTASAFNDKAAIKLPGIIQKNQMTLLEAVIAQTNSLAKHRSGRLSVFWSDQIFLPSRQPLNEGSYHIEILGIQIPFPSEFEWKKKGLGNYGILIEGIGSELKLLEKVDYHNLLNLLSRKKIAIQNKVAISLGSFSLSPQMTFALLREFETDLEKMKGRLDSDLHLWMPITLDCETYIDLMQIKGNSREKSKKHHERMKAFKTKFCHLHNDRAFFNFVDLGPQSYWWDFGSIKSYYLNMLKLTGNGHESQSMKALLRVDPKEHFEENNRVIKDEGTCLINCNLRSGKITNSILVGVHADSIEANDCIIVDSQFKSVEASHSLFYNVKEENNIRFSQGTVRADLLFPRTNERILLYSHQGRDGKADWKTTLPQNSLSFEQAYNKIQAEYST